MTHFRRVRRLAIIAIAVAIPLTSATLPSVAATRTAAAQGWRINHVVGPVPVDQSFFMAFNDSLSAVTATDAWAGWQGGGIDFNTRLIQHWTGRAWQNIHLPADMCVICTENFLVGASSASNVWVVSKVPSSVSRWNGRVWQTPGIPSWVLKNDGPVTIAVFSRTNVWFFGVEAPGAPGLAAHYNGRSWAKVPVPAAGPTVSALSPTDIWGLGTVPRHQNTYVLVHWNGRRWTAVRLPKETSDAFEGPMLALGPANAWVARQVEAKPGGPIATVALLNWNGRRWHTVKPPIPGGEVTAMAQDGHGGLWAAAAKGVFRFYHLHSGRWTAYSIPLIAGAKPAGIGMNNLEWIPGTRSVWAGAEVMVGPNSDYGVFYKFGS